jgi:hypothetical protein
MSIEAMNYVWGLDLEPTPTLVMLAYADHAHRDGTHIYPSIARIVKKTGLSRRWVQTLSHELAAAGLLIDDGIGPNGQRRWRIALPPEGATAPLPSPDRAARAQRRAGETVQAAPAMEPMVEASIHADPGVQPAPPAVVEVAAESRTSAGPGVENAPLREAATGAAPDSSPEIPVENAPPATSAYSSPVHSSASTGEAHLTPGANPSSPEPSLTIKEPPIPGPPEVSAFEPPAPSVPGPGGAGPAYVNREKIPREFQRYMDIFHELTGLVPTQRVLRDWIAEFRVWHAEGITVEGIRRAHKEARYSIARPGSLTNMAAAFSARREGASKAAADPERERRANEILLWRIEQGRIRAAEGYKAMNMPYEDPATMRPPIEDLRKELEGTQEPCRPIPPEERGHYLDLISKVLPRSKRGRWSRR